MVVATGTSYADALAGGPAARRAGGPVLLVPESGVPVSVRAELVRLRPARITVLGGAAAVSDAQVDVLETYTAGAVTRVAGADRYDTAAALALSSFERPTGHVLVATGETFADALVGSAVGAATGSPVLLVTRGQVPATTAEALRRLQPREVTVLGGAGAVSLDVLSSLRGLAPEATVTRVSGRDRYGTAAALTQRYWPRSRGVVQLATGRDFADALAGVALSAAEGSPLLLTEPACLPTATRDELERLRPSTLVTLGGTASVSAAAAAGRSCASAARGGAAP